METYDIDFQFKGSRTYVHGTDIFNQIGSFINDTLKIGTIEDIDMGIHKIMRKNLKLDVLDDSGERKRDNTSVTFAFSDGKEKKKLFLYESDKEVSGRYPYPEDDIIALCDFNVNEKTITLTRKTEYTDIELFVAMNKGLMNKLFPDPGGKWYFTKLEIDRYTRQRDYNNITIQLLRNLNFKLTKSSIAVDNKTIGYIYFSLV